MVVPCAIVAEPSTAKCFAYFSLYQQYIVLFILCSVLATQQQTIKSTRTGEDSHHCPSPILRSAECWQMERHNFHEEYVAIRTHNNGLFQSLDDVVAASFQRAQFIVCAQYDLPCLHNIHLECSDTGIRYTETLYSKQCR